ncbi:uncharacterized protein MYCFIDRAFT_170427 [Pseudocercospora fijiensis CIRAD86]|uniref:DUF7071 domain-containing protein n=1 Tax=Pseudocercospora fijiensis (strain CIRAD86) TaxID=383855 RepID=N1QC41_PSEFD|nr:uncharacterized protein MYCFIDRAFT_170427 [Pseudocercospora fijiensis CIRAD86]EME88858.1 hypothetical protein MYCFIDRAFT_170427 [Pseudocercospora fijiensis CIRAD86]
MGPLGVAYVTCTAPSLLSFSTHTHPHFSFFPHLGCNASSLLLISLRAADRPTYLATTSVLAFSKLAGPPLPFGPRPPSSNCCAALRLRLRSRRTGAISVMYRSSIAILLFVLSIEQTLGLKSERGISRQSNKDAPPVKAALKGIKMIQTAHVHRPLDEIRDSQPLKDDATRLFHKYAPQIWPGPENDPPAWLEEPSPTRHDARYPRQDILPQRVNRTLAGDKLKLTSLQTATLLHRARHREMRQCKPCPRAQRREDTYTAIVPRESTAEVAAQQLQEDTFHELEDTTYVHPEQSIDKEEEPDQDSGIGASPLEQPRLTDKSRAFHEQFAAYTSPVPSVPPHGLPSVGGVYARPPSSPSSAVRFHQTSQKRLPGQTPPPGRSKRARVIREDGTRADSLVIRLRVSSRRLSRLASTGSCWSRTEVPSARVEPDTIAVGTQPASTHPPPNPSAYVSPYRQTLPWNGAGNDQSGAPRNTVHVDLTVDEDQPPPAMSDVREILGDFADCTVARELIANYPNMSRDRLENLRSVLDEFPDTRDDLFLLEKRIRALATGPRVLSSAQRRSSSVSQTSRPAVRSKTPAVERTAKLAEEILGRLCACSAAVQVLDSYPLMSREQLEVLRSTFINYPETQTDFPLLQKIVRFEAFDVVTGATAFPRKRSLDGQLKQVTPTVEPNREGSADESKKESLNTRRLDNITVEINWGRDTEYTDHIDLQEFDSGPELFRQIESYLPDELKESGRIKEVRVKCITDLHGGNIQPRIARDEGRGKAAVRQLIKKLRAQPADMEIELAFLILLLLLLLLSNGMEIELAFLQDSAAAACSGRQRSDWSKILLLLLSNSMEIELAFLQDSAATSVKLHCLLIREPLLHSIVIHLPNRANIFTTRTHSIRLDSTTDEYPPPLGDSEILQKGRIQKRLFKGLPTNSNCISAVLEPRAGPLSTSDDDYTLLRIRTMLINFKQPEAPVRPNSATIQEINEESCKQPEEDVALSKPKPFVRAPSQHSALLYPPAMETEVPRHLPDQTGRDQWAPHRGRRATPWIGNRLILAIPRGKLQYVTRSRSPRPRWRRESVWPTQHKSLTMVERYDPADCWSSIRNTCDRPPAIFLHDELCRGTH